MLARWSEADAFHVKRGQDGRHWVMAVIGLWPSEKRRGVGSLIDGGDVLSFVRVIAVNARKHVPIHLRWSPGGVVRCSVYALS